MDLHANIIKDRGKRFRMLRLMTNSSIDAFAEQIGVSGRTIKGWEQAKGGGVHEKAAEKAVEAARRLKVEYNVLWLMHGIGSQPILIAEEYNKPLTVESLPKTKKPKSLNSSIKKEIKFFHKNNPSSVTLQIADDSMEPYYNVGDIVGGQLIGGDRINNIINTDCIVETSEHQILCRYVTKGSKNNLYNLICVNRKTQTEPAIINDVKLISAAPIIWIRRLNNF
jgi:transcriptional regulator with XRE-family HTH domain